MKKLQEIYDNFKQIADVGHGDKGTTHSYIDVYEYLLTPYRNNSNVLEIGLAYGESLELWYEYFINSNIYGLDVQDIEIKKYINDPRFKINIADATKSECLEFYKNIQFDVIIDDGSHILEDQIKTYNLFKPYIKSDGIYIIEDVANIDYVKNSFFNLDPEKTIDLIDLRHIKNRYDDVLIVIQ